MTAQTQRYTGRIAGLDVARGLAVLGMFTAHIGPEVDHPLGSWLLQLAHGRSSILFAVLAGVSLAILTGRNIPYEGREMARARLRILGRAFTLFAIAAIVGLMNSYVAIILAHYAVWFILATACVRWRWRTLVAAATGCWLVGPFVRAYGSWLLENLSMFGTGPENFLVDILLNGMYPGVIFMGFVFAGMALGRLDITRATAAGTVFGLGLVFTLIGYGSAYLATEALDLNAPESEISVSSWSKEASFKAEDFAESDEMAFGSVDADPGSAASSFYDASGWADIDDKGYWHNGEGPEWNDFEAPGAADLIPAEAHSGTVTEAVGSGGFALALIGLLLLANSWIGRVLYPVGAVGSMPLTAYSLHIVIIWAVPGMTFPATGWPLCLLAGGMMIFCSIWRPLLGRGPLERLMYRNSVRLADAIVGPSGADPVEAATRTAASA